MVVVVFPSTPWSTPIPASCIHGIVSSDSFAGTNRGKPISPSFGLKQMLGSSTLPTSVLVVHATMNKLGGIIGSAISSITLWFMAYLKVISQEISIVLTSATIIAQISDAAMDEISDCTTISCHLSISANYLVSSSPFIPKLSQMQTQINSISRICRRYSLRTSKNLR